MNCPIDPTPLQPPLRTEEFETLFHLLKLATICQDLSVLAVTDIDNVGETILNHLAQQFDVLGYKGWLLADTDEKKRALLKQSVRLHRTASTPYSIETALAILDITVTEIIENPPLTYDGTWQYNGAEFYDSKKWDRFIVKFANPVPPALEELVFNLIEAWKNARSHPI